MRDWQRDKRSEGEVQGLILEDGRGVVFVPETELCWTDLHTNFLPSYPLCEAITKIWIRTLATMDVHFLPFKGKNQIKSHMMNEKVEIIMKLVDVKQKKKKQQQQT